ncbi:MAG TPA: molybdenum cofactor guanylyltransferase [Terriglobales bacterium]|nr:molybdenum cofactor guanylyltransferase [Terriglobales bacterium]
MPPRSDITGFVLAGGKSRRMGTDKAQIPWDAGTLLTHAVDRMEQVVKEVFVVGGPGTGSQETIPDSQHDSGPLAGIDAALARTNTEWNLFLALDLPLISSALLELLGKGTATQAGVVVPRVVGALQPLCAVYRRTLRPVCRERLQAGDLSILRLLAGVETRIMEEDELRSHGFTPEMFLNVNTPQDLARARQIAVHTASAAEK